MRTGSRLKSNAVCARPNLRHRRGEQRRRTRKPAPTRQAAEPEAPPGIFHQRPVGGNQRNPPLILTSRQFVDQFNTSNYLVDGIMQRLGFSTA